MSYIGTEPKDIRSFGRTKFDYTATQGQTAFTGADDDGKVLAFTVGQIEVYVNGILMDDSDFTTTGTGTVTLASAANLNDVISIVSFETNIPDSNYVPASGGTFTGNVTHSGTVTNSGNVTVGGTLGVTGAVTASNGLTVDDDGATPLTVDRATNDGTIIDVQKDGTSVGSIGIQSSGFYIDGESGHEGIRFGNGSVNPRENGADSDGTSTLGTSSSRWQNLFLSGGVYLGGTGASNKLSDFETGTFVPTLSCDNNGSLVLDTSSDVCAYVKIGALVCCHGSVAFNGSGASGNFRLGSFPFGMHTTLAEQSELSAAAINLYNTAININGIANGEMSNVSGDATLLIRDGGGTTSGVSAMANHFGASTTLRFSVQYRTDE